MNVKKTHKTYSNTARLWHFLRKSRVWFALGITCAFAMTGLEMIAPQIVNFTVDNLLKGNEWEPPAFVASFRRFA